MVEIFFTIRDEPFDDAMSHEVDEAALEKSWLSDTAQQCAEKYHSDHDGWEDDWMGGIPFTLWRKDQSGEPVKLGRFVIEREAVPFFYVTESETV